MRTAPTARADAVYAGVLYDALGLGSLSAAARRRATSRVRVTSSLFGLVAPTDRIPAYRLSGDAVAARAGHGGRACGASALGPVVTELVGDGLLVDLRSGMYAAFWRPAGLARGSPRCACCTRSPGSGRWSATSTRRPRAGSSAPCSRTAPTRAPGPAGRGAARPGLDRRGRRRRQGRGPARRGRHRRSNRPVCGPTCGSSAWRRTTNAELAGVKLSSLDQPVVRRRRCDQGRPGRLSRRGARADAAGAAGPGTLGRAGAARTGAVHAEEPAQVRTRLDPHDDGLGERLEAGGALPGLRRPADAGLARQPAGRGVPPGADAGRQRPADPPDPRPRPAGRRRPAGRVPDGGGGRAAGPAGAGRRRALRWREDQRRQGRARLRAADRGRRDPGRRGGDPGAGRAGGPPRPGHRDHRVRARGARRQGVRRLDPGRRRDRRRGVQPAGAAGRPGVVPGHLGRARAGGARRLHDPERRRAAAGRRSWAAAMASPRRCPPTWSPRATRSRSRGSSPCTRASGASGRRVESRECVDRRSSASLLERLTRPRRRRRTRRRPAVARCRAASGPAAARPPRGRTTAPSPTPG